MEQMYLENAEIILFKKNRLLTKLYTQFACYKIKTNMTAIQ
ncbi:MAG: hypothetical protein AMDU5_GPLC00007G0031 [Thermoplasmatales archaeon Gpl]|nr:MAG: hypothetical protein AMDU5_GPLC00007G0031 [Thermoplasmatales archaeon Gpl]